MRISSRILFLLFLTALIMSACGRPASDPTAIPEVINSPVPPSQTPTRRPSSTPPPPTPTPTSDPFADYFGLLAAFLESKHDIDVHTYNLEDSTLHLMIHTAKENEDILNNLSWRLINDIAFLLRDLDPEGKQAESMFGASSYNIKLSVFALDETFSVNSLTSREVLSDIADDEVNQVDWWELAELTTIYP